MLIIKLERRGLQDTTLTISDGEDSVTVDVPWTDAPLLKAILMDCRGEKTEIIVTHNSQSAKQG